MARPCEAVGHDMRKSGTFAHDAAGQEASLDQQLQMILDHSPIELVEVEGVCARFLGFEKDRPDEIEIPAQRRRIARRFRLD